MPAHPSVSGGKDHKKSEYAWCYPLCFGGMRRSREGRKVPKRQKPRGRLWLNDGSCIRLRPQHCYVWSYDFVEAQTHDGRKLRLMTLIDEFTRECLAIRVARRINSFGVIETMADVMLERGVPEHIRSDDGAEMTAKIVRSWLAKLGRIDAARSLAERCQSIPRQEQINAASTYQQHMSPRSLNLPPTTHSMSASVSRPNHIGRDIVLTSHATTLSLHHRTGTSRTAPPCGCLCSAARASAASLRIAFCQPGRAISFTPQARRVLDSVRPWHHGPSYSAILLASAMAATLVGRRANIAVSRGR
jgi:hypothetical protein